MKRLTDGSIRYIIDTSADKDHTGGNDTVAKAGKTILGNQGSAGFSEDVYTNGGAASVLAHENVLKRMSAPAGGEHSVHAGLWPTKTYAGRGYPMYLNGDAVQVIYMPAAHSDGDSVVFFHRADVIVTGDILDTTRFPVVDVDAKVAISIISKYPSFARSTPEPAPSSLKPLYAKLTKVT